MSQWVGPDYALNCSWGYPSLLRAFCLTYLRKANINSLSYYCTIHTLQYVLWYLLRVTNSILFIKYDNCCYSSYCTIILNTGRLNLSRQTNFTDVNRDRKKNSSIVQLAMSRIGNHTLLINALLKVDTVHTTGFGFGCFWQSGKISLGDNIKLSYVVLL